MLWPRMPRTVEIVMAQIPRLPPKDKLAAARRTEPPPDAANGTNHRRRAWCACP
jgi:hypothetical protein